jgi:hypothetical protein
VSEELMTVEPERMEVARPERGMLEGALLTEDLVKQMEEQVDYVRRMRLVVCKLTEPTHWMDFGGVPYLKDAGVHTIAATLGVEFSKPQIREEKQSDARGDWYAFRCEMAATWRGRTMHEVGYASTRDDLWKKDDPNQVKGDAEKKSITNAQHRLLNKITGIGGVTWDLLHSIGISRGQGSTVRFKGQEQRQTTGAGAWNPAKERLWGLLLELNGNEEKAAAEDLFRRTDNPTRGYQGIRDPAQLSDRQVEWLLKRVEDDWRKAGAFEETAPAAAAREPGSEG